MTLKSISSVAAATVLLAGSSAMADLVLFSSFEGNLGIADEYGPGYNAYFAAGIHNTLTDGSVVWTVGGIGDRAGVDQINAAYSPVPFPHGNSALDMNSYNRGSITTSLVTVVGQNYLMSFFLSGNGAGTISALPGGLTFSGNNSSWVEHFVSFTATSALTTISFESLSPEGAGGATLDNVRIETVPVPAAAYAGLVGLAGVAGVGFARRRKA